MWEPSVPRAGGPWFQEWGAWVRFLELGTCGSKIGKHWFERWGTSSSSNGEPAFMRLGRFGSKVWEPAVLETGNPWFEDWKPWVPTFQYRSFLELGTGGSKIEKHLFEGLGAAAS
jgi:hypothetical protein